jgi:hypothetical protein
VITLIIEPQALLFCDCEERSNRELCLSALLVCDCFVPRNDMLFIFDCQQQRHTPSPLSRGGIAHQWTDKKSAIQLPPWGGVRLPLAMEGRGLTPMKDE